MKERETGWKAEMDRLSIQDAVFLVIGLFFILAGLWIFFYPEIRSLRVTQKTDRELAEFLQETSQERNDENQITESGTLAGETGKESMSTPQIVPGTEGNQPDGTGSWTTGNLKKEEDPLYQKIAAYNEALSADAQNTFSDADVITRVPQELKELTGEVFGYLEIPAMDVTLPILIGASDANMSRGAAVLGQTSLPVGGTGTNSVIAGHRGYQGIPFFREIENLRIGDQVYITNRWETLTYQVDGIDIIDPYDTEKLKIREGEDRITLLTCHPYRSRGTYRYLVYCIRDLDAQKDLEVSEKGETADDATKAESVIGKGSGTEPQTTIETKQETPEQIIASDGTVYQSSSRDILLENLVRRIGGTVILILVICSCTVKIKRKGNKR